MSNWFYMNRQAFEMLLFDELGTHLAHHVISIGFDTPVSFMIGKTSNEILSKIQATFSRKFCSKIICNDHCLSCSLSPPDYAKLVWFVQRLSIMSPLSKPFIKKTSSLTLLNDNSTSIKGKNTTINSSSNEDCSVYLFLTIIISILILIIFFLAIT